MPRNWEMRMVMEPKDLWWGKHSFIMIYVCIIVGFNFIQVSRRLNTSIFKST